MLEASGYVWVPRSIMYYVDPEKLEYTEASVASVRLNHFH